MTKHRDFWRINLRIENRLEFSYLTFVPILNLCHGDLQNYFSFLQVGPSKEHSVYFVNILRREFVIRHRVRFMSAHASINTSPSCLWQTKVRNLSFSYRPLFAGRLRLYFCCPPPLPWSILIPAQFRTCAGCARNRYEWEANYKASHDSYRLASGQAANICRPRYTPFGRLKWLLKYPFALEITLLGGVIPAPLC